MSSIVDVLVAGYPALAKLDQHSEVIDDCKPCARFAVALMKGRRPQDVVYLRCREAQEWQAAVDAALAIVKERTDH
jgi:hypothetical protein